VKARGEKGVEICIDLFSDLLNDDPGPTFFIMLIYNLHHFRVLSKCVVGGWLARETSSDVSPTCSLFYWLMMSWGHVLLSLLVAGPLVYSTSISSLS
jgi:hypothetical protein